MKSPLGRGAVGDEDSWFGNDFFEVSAVITLVLANTKKIDGNMSVDGAVVLGMVTMGGHRIVKAYFSHSAPCH